MNKTLSPRSPFGSSSRLTKKLTRQDIQGKLEEYFNAKVPKDAVNFGYEIWRCEQSSLEFAHPMRPGSGEFYSWIGSFPFYYPRARWEYSFVLEEVLAKGFAQKIIDVGCGSGDFLGTVESMRPQNSRLGVELFEETAAKCRGNGHECLAGEVSELLRSGRLKKGEAGLVTSFHCLEHVEDPIRFFNDLLALRSHDGILAISTPLSPLPFECAWFDIQNHPPHHLTRWNVAAYEILADRTNQSVRFYFGPRAGRLATWVNSCSLVLNGPHKSTSRLKKLLTILAHPFCCFSILNKTSNYWRDADCPGAECILAVFTARE